MAQILGVILERRARRAIAYRPMPDDVVDRLIQAATLAPSCSNNQPWRFVVVRDKDTLTALKDSLTEGNVWARRSPCIVAVATSPELDCRHSHGRDYALFDVGLAVQNLILQGTQEGLYAHPIAGFRPEVVRRVLGIPEALVVVTLVILGYPGDEGDLTADQRRAEHGGQRRKPLDQVRCDDHWGWT